MNLKSLAKASELYEEVLEYDQSIIELESFINSANKWDKECVVALSFIQPIETKSEYKEKSDSDLVEVVMTPMGMVRLHPKGNKEEPEVVTHSFGAPVDVSVMFRVANVILEDVKAKRSLIISKLQNLGVKI